MRFRLRVKLLLEASGVTADLLECLMPGALPMEATCPEQPTIAI